MFFVVPPFCFWYGIGHIPDLQNFCQLKWPGQQIKRFPNKDLLVSRPLKSNEWKPNLKWQMIVYIIIIAAFQTQYNINFRNKCITIKHILSLKVRNPQIRKSYFAEHKGGGGWGHTWYFEFWYTIALLAPKVLLEDHWPLMTIPSHPLRSDTFALQRPRRHNMTRNTRPMN